MYPKDLHLLVGLNNTCQTASDVGSSYMYVEFKFVLGPFTLDPYFNEELFYDKIFPSFRYLASQPCICWLCCK